MFKTLCLAAVLAAGASAANADVLEVSGFGGYTSLGMGQVNHQLAGYKSQPGFDQTTTTDIGNGYVAGVDLSTGALIPVPFLSLGLRVEYLGADNSGEAAGTVGGEAYKIQEDPNMADALLGLELGVPIPGRLTLGVAVYGGYGEGFLRQSVSSNLSGYGVPNLYYGGGFVGEGEVRVREKLFSVLGLYVFGGMRWADLTSVHSAAGSFGAGALAGNGPPELDFSGVTGGAGLNLDF